MNNPGTRPKRRPSPARSRVQTGTLGNTEISRPLRLKRVLVAFDFSPPSQRALEVAARVAQECGATLFPLYVAEHVVFFDEAVTCPGHLVLEQLKEKLEQLARNQLTPATAVFPQVAVGKAWSHIVDLAKEQEADLIVIGTHGRTGLKHVLLGSTAEQVVRHAPCPVLVVGPSANPVPHNERPMHHDC